MNQKKQPAHILPALCLSILLAAILAFRLATEPPVLVSAADILDNLLIKAPEKSVTNFKVSGSAIDSVTLTWTKASDASTYYLSYWESGKPSSAVEIDDIGNVSEYKITNLKQKKYIFQIQTANKLRTGIPLKGKFISIEGAPEAAEPSGITFNHVKAGYCSLYIEGIPAIYRSQVQLFDASDRLLGTYSGNSTGVSIKDSCIKNNGFYAIRIRGTYEQAGGYLSCGDWTDPYYFSIPIKTLKPGQKNGKAVLKWNPVQGAQTYTVYISKNASSGFKKAAVTKNTSAAIAKFGSTKLKSKSTYYFKVSAGMTKKGQTYTAESPVVKIKIK